jgi:aminoglycoside 2'-N-acetyltransferase I
MHVVLVDTHALSDSHLAAIRRLLDEAFAGELTDDDWQHALGGWHALIEEAGQVVAHAAVVERHLLVGDRSVRAGYVEAVAVTPARQRTGLGSSVMRAISALIRERFELGALSSGEWGFYERLGWERWRGPTWVRRADGQIVRTPDEDEGVMVLKTERSGTLDVRQSIVCDERVGDSW